MMWAILRQRSYGPGICTLSYAALGAELGCKAWAARKYCHQLERVGLLRTTQRVGTTPMHETLWHERFNDSVQLEVVGANAPGGLVRSQRPPGASATGHIRNSGLKKVLHGTDSLKVESVGNRPAHEASTQPAAPGPSEKYFSTAERDAIRKHVDVIGLNSTGACIATLSRKAKFYGRTGFEVAAAIERAWRKVQSRPSTHPDKVQWIFAVVENEFAQRAVPSMPATRSGKMVKASELLKPLAGL